MTVCPFQNFVRRIQRFGSCFLLWAVCLLSVPSAFGQASVTLAWNPDTSTGIAGYHLYYGGASQTYTNMLSPGNVTNITVSGLQPGASYYFAVTAYNTAGLESVYSSEVSYTLPLTNTPPTVALTSPTSGAAYLAPANVSLAASIMANGHTITQVQFYNGSTLLGAAASPPYAFTWNNVPAGTYSLTAKAVYDAGSTVSSGPCSITLTNPASQTVLPAPWQALDIGAVGAAGSASFNNGVYTVAGAGILSGSADSFRFVYQPMSASGDIRVQLDSVQNSGSSALAGVMIRESLAANSRYVFMGISPGGSLISQRRSGTGGGTASTSTGTGTPPNTWVRVVRSGKSFSSYSSTNGVNWVLANSSSVSMAKNVYFGFAVASGQAGLLNSSVFSSATAVP